MKAWMLLVVLGISLLSGCNTTSHVVVGRTRPKILPSQVRVYLHPPAKYEEIALLDTTSLWSFSATEQGRTNSVFSRLKRQAAELGANGILLWGYGEKTIGQVGNVSSTATAYSTANATAYRSGNQINAYGSGVTNAYGSSTAVIAPITVKAANGLAIYVEKE